MQKNYDSDELQRHQEIKLLIRIHFILDNDIIHKWNKVTLFLAHKGYKIRLQFLPSSSPNGNQIKRLWKQMHDHVTQNHKHIDIYTLLGDVYYFLDYIQPFCKVKISTIKMVT